MKREREREHGMAYAGAVALAVPFDGESAPSPGSGPIRWAGARRIPSVRTRTVLAIIVVAAVAVSALVFALGSAFGPRANRPNANEPAPAPTSEAATAPVVAFYGDSYTLGTGASDPANRWSTVICAGRGWTEVNPSTNGLGFVNHRDPLPPAYPPSDEVSEVIAAQPDIVVITMGLNDNFSMPGRADAIQAAITADFDRLRTQLPDARLIAVEPFWYTDERPDSVEQIIGWVHAAADRVGADWIPGASRWIEHHPEWMADDGLHPNDEGYAQMSTRMDAALRDLGL